LDGRAEWLTDFSSPAAQQLVADLVAENSPQIIAAKMIRKTETGFRPKRGGGGGAITLSGKFDT
jgi:hypothetical protein